MEGSVPVKGIYLGCKFVGTRLGGNQWMCLFRKNVSLTLLSTHSENQGKKMSSGEDYQNKSDAGGLDSRSSLATLIT